jgi:hypothetical protein
MASIRIFSDEENQTFTISAEIRSAIVKGSGTFNPKMKYYLEISTSFRKFDNTAFPTYVVEGLTDVPPGSVASPSNYTELLDAWIEYIVSLSTYGESSSSSSDSSSSSSQSSNSSSSSSSDGI